MSKKVLVTGGTGFIGSHTVVELVECGFEPIIVDDLSNSRIEILDQLEKITGQRPAFYEVDLKDLTATKQIFKEHDLQAVIHFAATKAVGESVEKPLLYYRNNLQSLLNILDAMVESQVGSIVFSSSCTVYGEPDVLPVTEQSSIKPAVSPYGNTKQISEEIITDASTIENIKAISLRYFNPIGAHPSALIGELPQGVPNNLVPYLMQVADGEREYLSVFGDDYDTPDGTCIRDYIHVVDLAKAHIVAVERLLNDKNKQPHEFFNIGTGQGNSVLELIKVFEESTGVDLNYKITDRRPGDVVQVYADTHFANQELGWKAERDLADMLKTAWNWQQRIKTIF